MVNWQHWSKVLFVTAACCIHYFVFSFLFSVCRSKWTQGINTISVSFFADFLYEVWHVVTVLLLPADGRRDRTSLYCDLGLQLEGKSTTHFPLTKIWQTHAQRGTFPLSMSHTVGTTQRQRETAEEQGSSWTSEGKSAAYSSKEGESIDLREVNFSLNVSCDPAAREFVALQCGQAVSWDVTKWFLKVSKWIIFYVLSGRLPLSVTAVCVYILYYMLELCLCVVGAIAKLYLYLKQLFISTVSSWLTLVIWSWRTLA